MNIEEQLALLQSKLQELKKLDRWKKVFGAKRHKYKLNKVKTESELKEFEEKYAITLPKDYRMYLLLVGNGGAGPYYGLETLEDSLYVDLDYKRENEFLNPSLPFEITEAWNMDYKGDPDNEDEYEKFEEVYFDDKWTNGLIRICNFGCGVSMNLVVNGPEYGNIWVDDRGSDGGIYPDPYFEQTGRTTFLEWYNLWLKKSLGEAKSGNFN